MAEQRARKKISRMSLSVVIKEMTELVDKGHRHSKRYDQLESQREVLEAKDWKAVSSS